LGQNQNYDYCADIAAESSYLAKTGKVSDFLKNGPAGGK
jgi:hypothetical protein